LNKGWLGFGRDKISVTKKKLNYLSRIDVLSDMNIAELSALDRVVSIVKRPAGKIMYMPGDRGENVYMINSGRVQLYRISLSGQKLVIATLGPADTFGEMSIIGKGIHNTFAETIDECLLCVMDRNDVLRLIREHPQVAIRIIQVMGSRLTQLESNLESFAFEDVPTRLAGLLLRSAEEQGRSAEVVGFSHQELGEMLGSYRETITLTLNEFKTKGFVEIGRRRITLLDRGGLELLAQS
jgi:CRP-like cAMP-binding protein